MIAALASSYARTLSQTRRRLRGLFLAPARTQQGGVHLEPVQRIPRDLLTQLVGDERLEVHRRHLLLAVGDLLEALEGRVERLALELAAHLLQGFAQGVAAGVLAQHDRVA